jgi:hypothetical protein
MPRSTSDPRVAPRIALRTHRGETATAGDIAVTPESLVLTVRPPFAAFVWRRPSAVVVGQYGRAARLPIRDATRLAQCALVGGGLLIGPLARRRATGRKDG